MPNPSIDGVGYQVRIKYLLHGQTCYNVINFMGRGVQDLINDLLTPVLNCVTTHLIPVLADQCTVVGGDVKAVTGSVAQEAELTLTTDNVGVNLSDSLPSTNAAVLALKTTHPGRSGRGRMFIPGIPEDESAMSTLDPAFIAACVAFLACMATAFVNSDPLATPFFHWAVRSRKDDQFYPVTSTAVRNVIGTMRSRKVT